MKDKYGNDILCHYGCGQLATHKLAYGVWICSERWQDCPVKIKERKELFKKRYYNAKKNVLQRKVDSGNAKCFLCGKQANYVLQRNDSNQKADYVLCCCDLLKKCEKFHEYMSKLIKKRYRSIKGYRQRMALAMLEAQNRPEVSKSKSKTMTKLHRKDPNFQKNYKKGRKKFEKLVKELSEKGEHWSGDGTSNAMKHKILYETHKKKYCEHCGITHQLMNHIYKYKLHLHCVNKDYDDLSKENWITLCPICHMRLEWRIKKCSQKK